MCLCVCVTWTEALTCVCGRGVCVCVCDDMCMTDRPQKVLTADIRVSQSLINELVPAVALASGQRLP